MHKELKRILKEGPTHTHLLCKLWLSCAYWTVCSRLLSNWLNTVTHSLTGTISTGEERGGESVPAFCDALSAHACICNGTTRMQHPDIFGWRRYPGAFAVSHPNQQSRSCEVTSKHHPHKSVNRRPVFWWTFQSCSRHRLPHRGLAFLHLSSHTFPGSPSPLLLMLTGCPSLDNALASFDALLLDSRLLCCGKMWCVSFECHII